MLMRAGEKLPKGAAERKGAVNQSVSLAGMPAGGENTAELAWVFGGIWRGLSKKGDTPYPCSPGDKSAYTQSGSPRPQEFEKVFSSTFKRQPEGPKKFIVPPP